MFVLAYGGAPILTRYWNSSGCLHWNRCSNWQQRPRIPFRNQVIQCTFR